MQADLSRKLLRMFVDRIVNEIFPKESGALRMQQIGLFTLIYVLQGDKEPVTASRIALMTGQSNGQVHRQLQKLLTLELIERTRAPNAQGRGHAFLLSIGGLPGRTRRSRSGTGTCSGTTGGL